MKATVTIGLRQGVLDVQGNAVAGALHALGFPAVSNVRVGKVIEFDLPDQDENAAREAVTAMCERLLANTVIETYAIDIQSRLSP